MSVINNMIPKDEIEDVLVKSLASLMAAKSKGDDVAAYTLQHVCTTLGVILEIKPEGLKPYMDRAEQVLTKAIRTAEALHQARTETVQ